MAHPASLTQYPEEQVFLRHGATWSFLLHLAILGTVVSIAFLTHIKTIEQLMAEGGSIEQSGPAPDQTMEVMLRPDDLPPPPPTANPEFVKQVELPKPVVVPPPATPVATPPPQPVIAAKPRFTAPKATGTGESAGVSHLVIGSSGFPKPIYPYAAQVRHQTGTVTVSIQFDASGAVADADVAQSSGVGILDSGAISFIRAHWHDERFAGRKTTVPIEFDMN